MASFLPRSPLVFVAALLPAVLAAAPAVSTVTAVTVYLDRAVVTRSASVDLPAGDQVITFDQLPADLENDSLRVAGSGSAHATLGEVTADLVFPVQAPDDRVRGLEGELKAEQKQLRTLDDQALALEKERALLTRMADAAAQGTPGKDGTPPARLQPADMQQLLDFYGPALVKLSTGVQALDAERDPVKDKIAATQAQLEQLGQRQYKSTKTVLVRVSLAEAGKLDLALSYAIPRAQWRPAYEARLSSADHHLVLGYYGIVTQTTGEDWKGVTLTLSTAHPSVGGAVPELAPWFVDQQQVEAYAKTEAFEKGTLRSMSLSRVQAAPAAGALAGFGAPNLGAPRVLDSFAVAAPAAEVSTGATSATFRIPGTADIPSDNAPHKEPVARLPLDAELSYQTTPKLMPAAFLSAAVTNSSDYPFLGGPVAIFLDETFVANGRLKTVMPGEKFNLALGVDDGVAVERKLVNRFTEDLGLLTKKSRVTYNVLIKVANHRQTAVKLVVHDQIPISKQEKIEVVQIEPSPDKVKPDAQGLLTWTVELAPGEKQELPLKFSVTYPTDFQISGLE